MGYKAVYERNIRSRQELLLLNIKSRYDKPDVQNNPTFVGKFKLPIEGAVYPGDQILKEIKC